jgi:hypothetical protein
MILQLILFSKFRSRKKNEDIKEEEKKATVQIRKCMLTRVLLIVRGIMICRWQTFFWPARCFRLFPCRTERNKKWQLVDQMFIIKNVQGCKKEISTHIIFHLTMREKHQFFSSVHKLFSC